MKKYLCSLLLTLFLLAGCENDNEGFNLPTPEVLGPTGNQIFYPDQKINIRWRVPDSTQTVELQSITSLDSTFYKRGRAPFDSLDFEERHSGRTNFEYTWNGALGFKLYCGYRLRYAIITNQYQPNETKQVSAWSDIHYYRVYPYSSLTVHSLSVEEEFDFVTQISGNYYSGTAKSRNKINIDSLIVAKGYPLERLKFIKPASGYVRDQGGKGSEFSRIAIGFRELNNPDLPFDILADAYGIGYSPDLTFYPFGGIYRNLYDDLGKGKVNMNLAYILYDNQFAGQRHKVSIGLTMNCYFE